MRNFSFRMLRSFNRRRLAKLQNGFGAIDMVLTPSKLVLVVKNRLCW